jgi:dethiobiotin synthetase
MRGVFVTGTGTEVGKTYGAAMVAHSFAMEGQKVKVFKPVVTGLDEPGDPDHAILRRAARSDQPEEEIAPFRYGPPVSPHLAAAMAGEEIERMELLEAAHAAREGADAFICEGVGGLLTPINLNYQVRDLIVDLAMPVAIASPPGLGAINHTLLTIEAVQAVGLRVTSVILTPWPEEPGEIELSNRETIAVFGAVDVATLPWIDAADPDGWPNEWGLLGPPRG